MSQAKEDEPTDNKEKNELFPFGCRQSAITGSQAKDDEPTGSTGSKKNELFSFTCNVSELVLALANLKQGQEKHSNGMAFMESHASLFHAIHSIIKSCRTTAKFDKDIVLEVKEPDHPCFGVPQEEDVVKEDLDSAKDTQEDKDTCAPVYSKYPRLSKSKSAVLRRQQKHDLGQLPPAYLLPYLVLIKNCIPLPISIIQRQCLTGEILCRIQYFTLRRSKKKLPSELVPAKPPIPKLQTTKEVKYVTFDSLRDLQWKIYRGLLKRKPKTRGTWREATCLRTEAISIPNSGEYILSLLPKDWVIDDSLKFNEEMRNLLLQNG
ncbi:uncharacterized protein LOC134400428 [Elgaria multicarinata webbii]|uniref:uncharacterized protein LOC134400428 n=1 Tax=Elgaria multicarinata webbii TaxID=159646 RepID=UPI002FCD190D